MAKKKKLIKTELTEVNSSSIRAVAYDEETETLTIQFIKGSVYNYLNVPIKTYKALMRASSHGQYHASKIRGHFDYRRIV